MALGEVIELLSSDDEALPKSSNPQKKTLRPLGEIDSNTVLLPDDFDTTVGLDDTWAEGPSKRPKFSSSTATAKRLSTLSDQHIYGRRSTSPKAASRGKENVDSGWASLEKSDPILSLGPEVNPWCSKVKASGRSPTPKVSSRGKANVDSGWVSPEKSDPILSLGPEVNPWCSKGKASVRSKVPSDHSDDSLPDDLLSAPLRSDNTVSKLSGRTAALLASLSKPALKAKASTSRKISGDKSVSRDRTKSKALVGEEDSIGSDGDNGWPAKNAKIPKKSKLTEEERAAKERDKEKQKGAKAQAREEAKATSREQKAKEKEGDKDRKRLEKEEKAREKKVAAEIAEMNKLKLDKKDSTPEMIVDLPASIDGQSVDTQIREFLKNLQVDATLYQSPVPNVFRWRRKMKARWNAELDYFEPLEHMQIENEKHVMCLMTAKEFVTLVSGRNGDQDVETHIVNLKSAYDDCIPIYLIEGLSIWVRKNRTAENRAYQAKVLNQGQTEDAPTGGQHANSKRKRPTADIVDEALIEDALLRLQVLNGCLVHHTATSVETAEWVANFTQHISTIPYRYLGSYSFLQDSD